MSTAQASPPRQTTDRTLVYHLALRWRLYVVAVLGGVLGVWWYLVLSSFEGLPSAGMAVLVAALTAFLTDLFGYLLWQFLVVMRLVVTPQGIRYVGVLTNIWTPWSNVAGLDSYRYSGTSYEGLRLKRPALRASRIYGITRVEDPALRALLFHDGSTYTSDGVAGGGTVPAGPAESDASLPGLPNDFIPLQAFEPHWRSAPLGEAVARYAPWAVGLSDPSEAKPGGPPLDSRPRRMVILSLCGLLALAEIFVTVRAGAVWAGGSLFGAPSSHELISCVDTGGDCGTVAGVSFAGSRLRAVSAFATTATVRLRDGHVLDRQAPNGNFTSGALSPNGRYVAGGDLDGHLTVLNLQTHRAWTLRPTHQSINAIEFSPHSDVLAMDADDDVIRFLRASDGRMLGSFRVPADPSGGEFSTDDAAVENFVFAPDGRSIALTQLGGTAQVWTVGRHPTRRLFLDSIGASAAVFSPDFRSIAIGLSSGAVQIRSAQDGSVIQMFGTDEVTSVAFSPDGRLVAAGTRPGWVYVWRLRDGSEIHAYRTGTSAVTAVAIAPDDRRIAAGTEAGSVDLIGG